MKKISQKTINVNKNRDSLLLQTQLQELNTKLATQDARLVEQDNQLSQIYMSKEWKLAKLLYRISNFLAPVGSYREKLGQFTVSALLNNDFIWNMLFSLRQVHKKEYKSSPKTTITMSGIKPKISYIVAGTAISGGLAVICEQANRLLQRGYDVSIITEDNLDRISWFPDQIVPVIPIEKSIGSHDILIATGWTTAYTVQKLEANRKFYFVQSDESRFYPPGDFRAKRARKTYEMDFELITMAQWLEKWLKDHFGKSATYIPNGINEKIIFPDKPIEDKSAKKVRILLEGSINTPFKGMEDAFMAVNDLDDCEVWCVSSSGTLKPGWKCDKFFSQIPFDKMRHIYSSCDILLKMSRVESFCYPPLEMMACGGTAVIGQVTGIEEYAIDGYNSLIIPPGDIKAAHNALKKLIEDKGLRSRLSENGKKTAENFHWDASIDKLEKIFSEKPKE